MRVGLLGFGSIAEHGHLPALRSFSELEVVAVADVSGERLERARELLPDVEVFKSAHDLLTRVPLEVADICSPPSTHAELIVAACERGIPTIVSEKPLVLSSEEYARISEARAANGSRVISVNNWMDSDLHRETLGLIAGKRIGRIERIDLRTERPAAARGNTGWMPNWRTDPMHSGGGIILDHGWHQLYLILNWVGSPLQAVRATARTANPDHEPVEDEATVELGFAGAEARIDLKWTGTERRNEGLIRGSDGTIEILDDRIVLQNGARNELRFTDPLTKSSYHPDWFRSMFDRTLLASDRTEADRSFADAGLLVAAIDAAYRSAAAGGVWMDIQA